MWSDLDEKIFISGIGSYSTRGMVEDRRALLQNYIAGMSLRENWDAMNPAKVLDFARAELKKIEEPTEGNE